MMVGISFRRMVILCVHVAHPISFFVNPADSDKVLIHFQGGGACWDSNTCSVDEPTFLEAVSPLSDDYYPFGIFDREHPANPVADYNMIVVSYCTGDLHTG